jgi:hypothetical protein
MHSKYYYLVASLPYLKFAEEPPISSEVFMAECEKWLTPEDLKTLVSADIKRHFTGEADSTVLAEWKKFDARLREELAKIRAARKLSQQVKAPDFLESVTEKETPLLMEEALERIRWDCLEGKSAEYMFDINWLVLYFLKLQIAERLATFDKDKGESFFYELCEVKYE